MSALIAADALDQVISRQEILQSPIARLGSREDARHHVGKPEEFFDQRADPLDMEVLRQCFAGA